MVGFFPRCGDACHGGAAVLVVNSPVLEQSMGDTNHLKILLVRFYRGACPFVILVSRVSGRSEGDGLMDMFRHICFSW